jgi:hypothetical protein
VRELKKATGSFPGFGFGVTTKAVRAEHVCWPAGCVGLATCSSLFEKILNQCTASSDEACLNGLTPRCVGCSHRS